MKKISLIITAFICFVTIALAQIPDRPVPPRLVNDFANILTDTQRIQLEDALVQFAQTSSTQIVVVTVADLEGNDPGDYAFNLGEKWGVGQKGKNNGIVMLVKPKLGNSKGQVFIATGYGLEGILPDAVVNSTVIDFEMIPRFKQNDYFGGIASGLNVIMDITRGEYTAEQYQQKVEQNKEGGGFIPAILIFIMVFIFIMRGRKNRVYSGGRSLPFWLAMGMMSGGHRSGGGSFGNFSSGSGGFGGFGGGSFGGGGAGGSW